MRHKTAALVVIGNEILSGKVTDTNSAFLARELRKLGVALKRILVVPDELEAIGDAVREHHLRHDVVFTSGGVGPTHDDITIAGIARGLGRRVIRHPVLEKQIRAFAGEATTDAHLKMAEVPEGAELVWDGHLKFPALLVENIYVLPGIPELFVDKFTAIKSRFAVDPFFLRVLYLRAIESTLAAHLNATLRAFPDVEVGSYPKLNHPEYSVCVTLESKDESYLNQAFDHLLGQLPVDVVVRTE